MKQYIRPLLICVFCLIFCFGVYYGIKFFFFDNYVSSKNLSSNGEYAEAVTKAVETTTAVSDDGVTYIDNIPSELIDSDSFDDESIIEEEIEDDGSIIYDGMTLTELTDKLNRSLKSNLAGTGYYFANFTRKYGVDPYLLVAVTFAEAGCNNVCAPKMAAKNNYVGMIYNGSLLSYPTVEKGLTAFFNSVYYYWSNGYTNEYLFAQRWNPGSANYGNDLHRWIEYIKSK